MAPAKQEKVCIDGNEAAAYVAYAVSDGAVIYPITPSSTMGELADAWSGAKVKNIFDEVVKITMMQSEGGAAGAVHGSLTAGALTTTFTASQGLLLMIPNMYKIAGELQPCVFHVAARAIAGQGLSIYGDHSDVMACRQTGFCMLSSHTVQEAHDMALVAHLAALEASLPFLHFFDGFRTSHELNDVSRLDYATIKTLVPMDKIKAFRKRAISADHPSQRGTSQGPDIFFQMVESGNAYYNAVPQIVKNVMKKVEAVTGRTYHLFDYVGAPDAEDVIVLMGSGAATVGEVVEYMVEKGAKVGVLKVHLYRPWSADDFVAALPKTCKRLAVLDRTKEPGCYFEPLALDVATSIQQKQLPIVVAAGRYGLGSKDFTPGQVEAIYKNLASPSPKMMFTVGFNDDVTHLSLPFTEDINTVPAGTKECMFWGVGADGTVGANKNSIKVITDHTDLHTQGYFEFDAHKSGGVTVSHLRFGPKPINSIYLLQHADFVAVHNETYTEKYGGRLVAKLRKGGIVLLNSHLSPEEITTELNGELRRALAAKDAKVYTIDGLHEAMKNGQGKHINIIMQVCFFHLANIIPAEVYVPALKKAIAKTYAKKGPEVVAKNQQAVDAAINALREVKYNKEEWLKAADKKAKVMPFSVPKTDFVTKIQDPMIKLEGDDLPVSVLKEAAAGGFFPMGTTKYEKRGIGVAMPIWDESTCIQCNKCSTICPHACIRPFLFTQEEMEKAPNADKITSLKAQGREGAGFRYRIQVSPYDCTGCTVCTQVCPAGCLKMSEMSDELKATQGPLWNYFVSLPTDHGEGYDRFTVKGAQFRQPLLEFSGACDGCGETPYVKLLTQLFGERMILAQATGCSSIWGGTAPTNPYTVRPDGRGPGWANSLFEDNAEYGLGMVVAFRKRRESYKNMMAKAIAAGKATGEIKALLEKWMAHMQDHVVCEEVRGKLIPLLKNAPGLEEIAEQTDLLSKPSHWFTGGDGWAYDIGYGGLDHVLYQGQDCNILVMDTEMYSNTGGQMSKATPLGAVAKFAATGKRTAKKDLGRIAMANEQVYVASVALDADMNQCLKAFQEAEAYPGTSLIVAYAPCIAHGMNKGMAMGPEAAKQAVESGYWPLYRYNPALIAKGECPLQLDSTKLKENVLKFVEGQNRFTQLQRGNPEIAKDLNQQLAEFVARKFKVLKDTTIAPSSAHEMSVGLAGTKRGEDSLVILYVSESGNAAGVAQRFATEARGRGLVVEMMPADEFDFADLSNLNRLLFVGSTCGQGEIPSNGKSLIKEMTASTAPKDHMKGVKFAVFGLGDSAYTHFNVTAKKYEAAFLALGATALVPAVFGDDQDADKYETKLESFEPEYWEAVGKKRLREGPADATFKVEVSGTNAKPARYVPSEATILPLTKKVRLTPADWDRDISHYEIDAAGTNFKYGLCDAIAIWPENDPAVVEDLISAMKLTKDACLKISALDGAEKKLVKELPKETTVYQLFHEVLDIAGRPNSRFYSNIAYYANDADKAAIKALLANKEAFRTMVDKEKPNYVDIIRKFPSVQIPLERMLEMIPLIKPRLYSCASSPRMHPTKMELCIVTVDWVPTKADGTKMPVRKGLCTGYLTRIAAGEQLKVGLKPSAMEMPEDARVPVIMTALGTGLAPFRAMCQERAALKRSGKAVGEQCLYYGCRYKAKEYLYGDEFEVFEKEGSLTRLRPAFSRDQPKKVYINNKIEEDTDYLYKALVEEKGYVFYCGSAGETPAGVRKSIKTALVKSGKINEEGAEKVLTEMEQNHRYVVEAW